jgi:hypothetical protein
VLLISGLRLRPRRDGGRRECRSLQGTALPRYRYQYSQGGPIRAARSRETVAERIAVGGVAAGLSAALRSVALREPGTPKRGVKRPGKHRRIA